MKKSDSNLMDWLGMNNNPDFSRGRWLGGCIGALVLLITLALVVTGLLIFARLISASFGNPIFLGDGSSESIRNFGLLLTALFAAPFLVWRSVIAQKQAVVAEQGHITDRINKAVEGLGATRTMRRQRMRTNGKLAYENDKHGKPDFSKPIFEEVTEPNLEVRIGSIFALERIAEDSLRDHVQIMEILCAYIRANSRDLYSNKNNEMAEKKPSSRVEDQSKFRMDLQTALEVVTRRSPDKIEYEASLDPPYRLDFSDAILDGVHLMNGRFGPANFVRVQANNASMRFCDFRGAWFYKGSFRDADLDHSCFKNIDVFDTIFDGATLSECDFSNDESISHEKRIGYGRLGTLAGSYKRAYLFGTKWSGAKVAGNFTDASFMDADFAGANLGFGCKFTGAFLFYTNFSKAKEFQQSILDETIGISHGEGETLIPVGFEYPDHWEDMDEIRKEFEADSKDKLGVLETYESMLEEWRNQYKSSDEE